MTIEPNKMLIRIYDASTIRVMTVVDGKAIVRIPGCMPFVLYVKDMHGTFMEPTK